MGQDAAPQPVRRHAPRPSGDSFGKPWPQGPDGRRCPLAARGYSRDGKLQIDYGLLTDPAGRPPAVPVFEGSTAAPAAFTQIVTVVRAKFGLTEMVGGRGMITAARISALSELDDPYRVGDRAARSGHQKARRQGRAACR